MTTSFNDCFPIGYIDEIDEIDEKKHKDDIKMQLFSTCGSEFENLTNTEISYLNGVTSNIQTQINNLNSGGGGTSLYYYNLKYDYEGGIFPIIKDPNLNATTDISVSQSVYDQAQLIINRLKIEEKDALLLLLLFFQAMTTEQQLRLNSIFFRHFDC